MPRRTPTAHRPRGQISVSDAAAARSDRHRRTAGTPAGTARPRRQSSRRRFFYSNTHYILAAMIVEKVTGRSYGEELTQRITRPLDLTGALRRAIRARAIDSPGPRDA
ncbi:serine hydrolase domain-containing protein [Nocardia rhamnosiphila]